jgi:fatty-acyl-CoA synthase
VGLVIHNLEAKLMRADGAEAGPGEPGELWLRGPVVCAGYLDDAAATASAIVDGWFRTGDLLQRDADGFFYVRGRIKEMFISGGENVYPAEVEAAILDHPDVALAAVVGVPDARWGEVGLAFVQPRVGAAVDPAGLTAFLGGRLAKYKIPKAVRVLDELPRIGSGKIDKARLAALGAA